MIAAVVVAVAIMMFSAKAIGDFVMRHPTVKVLALSFLLMIGLTLIADGVGFHIPKGYIYFAMGFSIFVEMINLRIRPAHAPVKLHGPYGRRRRRLMPFKSQAQRRKFAELLVKGEISNKTYEEWNRETGGKEAA